MRQTKEEFRDRKGRSQWKEQEGRRQKVGGKETEGGGRK
jgi:hypothetical protein